MEKIYFFSRSNKYFEFSTFSPHPIIIDGKVWKTVMHYFKAQKFADEDFQEVIRMAPTPSEAAKLGEDRKHKRFLDWENRKVDVMKTATIAKFEQYPKLKELLLSTGDAELILNNPKDYTWGCGLKQTGKNLLGKILMEYRDELKK